MDKIQNSGGEGVGLRLNVNGPENTTPIQNNAAFIQRLCLKHLGQLNLHHPDNNYFIPAKRGHIGTLKLVLLYKCL